MAGLIIYIFVISGVLRNMMRLYFATETGNLPVRAVPVVNIKPVWPGRRVGRVPGLTAVIFFAAVFLVAYTIYAASSIKACGKLFHTVIGINEFTADNVTRAPVEEPCVEYDNGQTGKKRVVWGTFTGTYVADYVIPYSGEDVSLFLSGNQLYYASAKTKHMKAYRACFWFSDILTTTGDASAPITMSFNDVTGINASMNNQGVKNEGWYTIGGVKLSAEPTQKGLYIHNGNKEVIK